MVRILRRLLVRRSLHVQSTLGLHDSVASRKSVNVSTVWQVNLLLKLGMRHGSGAGSQHRDACNTISCAHLLQRLGDAHGVVLLTQKVGAAQARLLAQPRQQVRERHVRQLPRKHLRVSHNLPSAHCRRSRGDPGHHF